MLALSKSSSSGVVHPDLAPKLVAQLAEYLPEAYCQTFRPSPFLLDIKPSPWEELTRCVTAALLSIGSQHVRLLPKVAAAVTAYLVNCAKAVDAMVSESIWHIKIEGNTRPTDTAEIMAITASVVGFLESVSQFTHLWSAAEKMDLLRRAKRVLSEGFLVAVETASSTIRNLSASDANLREWRRYSRRYAARGRPLGAMLLQQAYMRLIKSCTITTVLGSAATDEDALLDQYMIGIAVSRPNPGDATNRLVGHMAGVIAEQVQVLQDGADYLQLGSPWQQELAHSVKALAFVSYLNCTILDDQLADADTLLSWLEDTIVDESQMASIELATATLRTVASMARLSPTTASILSQALLKFIVQGGTAPSIVAIASQSLSQVLNIMCQDSLDPTITTLYTLGNVLSQAASPSGAVDNGVKHESYAQLDNSVLSFSSDGEGDSTATYRNVIHAIVTISTSCNDPKITALAQSMLLQKIGKISLAVDAAIIQETARLGLSNEETEFDLLLKFYTRLHKNGFVKSQSIIVDAVQNAREYLAANLQRNSPLYRIYLIHLLESIVSKGDVSDLEHDRHKDIVLSPVDIIPLLKPLALLLCSQDKPGDEPVVQLFDDDTAPLFRDTWFNIVVHGISINSDAGRRYRDELSVLAKYSPPLVPENRTEVLESDVELNMTLRRGMSSQRQAEQRKWLVTELPEHESEIKRLNYQKLVFLNASVLVEILRASSGECTKILTYFLDPSLNTAEMGGCMAAVARKVVDTYLSRTLKGKEERFSARHLSKQLAKIFVSCCHRIARVQEVAVACADRIISASPSALCDRSSLFVLLDLLSVMWSSCLDSELEEYGWKSTFTLPRGDIRLELSDNYEMRRYTMRSFHSRAKSWVTAVINIAPLDVKGLLQVSGEEECIIRVCD